LKAVIKPVWHIPVPNVQWKTPDDRQRNCLKHAEFLDKNKFGKISASVGFIKKKPPVSRFSVKVYFRHLKPASSLPR
jgi:hypothetical protein